MIENVPILRISSSSLLPSAVKTLVLNTFIVSAFLISFTSSTHKPEISDKSGSFFDSAKFFKNRSLSGLSILVIEFLNSPLVWPDTC